MPFFQNPFDRSYEDYSANDLIVTLNHAADKAEDHPAFQGELSEYVSRAPRLREIATLLAAARDAAVGRGKAQVEEEKRIMGLAVMALNINAHHIALISVHRNDPSLLNNSGYDQKPRSAAKAKVNLLDLVPELTAKHLPGVSGAAVINIKRAKINANVELQATETPDDESSWRGFGEGTYNRSRIERRGLVPATKMYFRARYHEDGAAGRWSPPVSLIIL